MGDGTCSDVVGLRLWGSERLAPVLSSRDNSLQQGGWSVDGSEGLDLPFCVARMKGPSYQDCYYERSLIFCVGPPSTLIETWGTDRPWSHLSRQPAANGQGRIDIISISEVPIFSIRVAELEIRSEKTYFVYIASGPCSGKQQELERKSDPETGRVKLRA